MLNRNWLNQHFFKKVQQEKDMYLIKSTKAVLAVLNTPDTTNNKEYHLLQQSSGQSA